jgi:hypothetical protein
MKRYVSLSIILTMAILLSSCSMHLGLGKLFNGSAKPAKTKKIKATHTPPSPATGTPAAGMAPVSTPAAVNVVMAAGDGFTQSVNEVKADSSVTWTNIGSAGQAFTSHTGAFNSGSPASAAVFAFTFK